MRIEHATILLTALCAVVLLSLTARAGHDGLLRRDGVPLFPIGFYELPRDEAGLRAMAQAGVNLVRCGSRADLDRVHAAGMLGWIPLPLHLGATQSLREMIEAVRDHPALAVWEGPDEIVWSFTAWSGLEQAAGIKRGEWWAQTPRAVEYAEGRSREIMPRLHESIALVRELDARNRPIWFNEARSSDAKLVREYVDWVDITGCDDYPVRAGERAIARIGDSTERWKAVGRGKPVWMVLQAFSWSALEGEAAPAYPSFAESRFMAYDAIAHGAKGILYWGSHYLDASAADFRDSIYALTRELAALQAFLTAPEQRGPSVTIIGDEPRPRGVALSLRESADEWLIIVANEDNERHMAVEVSGLEMLNGARLCLLYGSEESVVAHGTFITRMQPYQVKVFATSRRWETGRRVGREFGQRAAAQ